MGGFGGALGVFFERKKCLFCRWTWSFDSAVLGMKGDSPSGSFLGPKARGTSGNDMVSLVACFGMAASAFEFIFNKADRYVKHVGF